MSDIITFPPADSVSLANPHCITILLCSGLLPAAAVTPVVQPPSTVLCLLRAPLRMCQKIVARDGVRHLGWYVPFVQAPVLREGRFGWVRILFPDTTFIDAVPADFGLSARRVTPRDVVSLQDIRVLHPRASRFRA